MKKKNEITVTRKEFHDTLGKLLGEWTDDPLFGLRLALFCAKVEVTFFREGDDTDTEAPFKSGDTVFVTDNECDYNNFVNRVVTVVKVDDYGRCEVTDGKCEQTIYFKNLRKVETP